MAALLAVHLQAQAANQRGRWTITYRRCGVVVVVLTSSYLTLVPTPSHRHRQLQNERLRKLSGVSRVDPLGRLASIKLAGAGI